MRIKLKSTRAPYPGYLQRIQCMQKVMRTIQMATRYRWYFKSVDIKGFKAQQILELQNTTQNRCRNALCRNDEYMVYKYSLSQTQILRKIRAGQRLVKVNSWRLCKRCRFRLYCCRKCQKIDWKNGHRTVCHEPTEGSSHIFTFSKCPNI